ncbi:uncharacterized protein SAPINGB_P001256 [Magnusiomyces paraingens]|uniref:peptide-methionine (S)-S-oxide reductase n=1 Tax=Magnusiomyces paraingens TaxID=2606893 RepID=A0A5E8BAZ6_9ASCO|nr:uncharacterized protein SAPINGB_P001256 [Saprochaete ingens]VVT46524.1 unnamed protein product [Saprochaete ingens]
MLQALKKQVHTIVHKQAMSTKSAHSSIVDYGVVSPTLNVPEGAQVATYGAGCFWGVEHMYRKHFAKRGLIDCKVGYAGGAMTSPTYNQVCTGGTGHAEVVQLSFDPKTVSYYDLTLFFFRMHDPTTLNSQGPDRGSQYRSAIFYHSDAQKTDAERARDVAQEKYFPGARIVTQIVKADSFWDAEKYHQKYLQNNPGGYECPSHYLRGESQL